MYPPGRKDCYECWRHQPQLADNRFVEAVPTVRKAVVVSSDGLPMAVSPMSIGSRPIGLAAVASGMIGLAYGSAGRFGAGSVSQCDHRDDQRVAFHHGHQRRVAALRR